MKTTILTFAALLACSVSNAGAFGDAFGQALGQQLGGFISDSQTMITKQIEHKTPDKASCESTVLQLAKNTAVSECQVATNKKCNPVGQPVIVDPVHPSVGDNGPYTVYGKGGGKDKATAEAKAIKNAELQANSTCVQYTGSQCQITVKGFIVQAASKNPAVAIGGTSGDKYEAKAQASASPTNQPTAQYACSARASAKPIKKVF